MKQEELQAVLATARGAIREGDHQRLYQVIAKVTDGVSNIAKSSDVFISELERKPNKIVPIPVRKNK